MKRAGKYRNVRPTGKLIDNFTWWYCPECGFIEERPRPRETTVDRYCVRPHTGGAYYAVKVQPLPVGVDMVVFEAALRVGGAPAAVEVVLEYIRSQPPAWLQQLATRKE